MSTSRSCTGIADRGSCVAINLGEALGPVDKAGKVPLAALGKKDPALKKYYGTDHKEATFPPGYYVDVTAIIEANGFSPIPAHDNWQSYGRSWEWWHFNYSLASWGTFLDECELVTDPAGDVHGEARLRGLSWPTDNDLDAHPG